MFVLVLDAVSSTNDVAFAEGRARLTELRPLGGIPALAVRAARQSAGRGRVGRTWESPAGSGLYLSLYLSLAWTARQAAWLTLAAGLATRTACVESLGGVAPDLKWPNDLLVPDGSGRKLGGILVETRTQGGRVEEAVVGIGVNLVAPDGGSAPGLAVLAGSVAELGNTVPPSAERLTTRILAALAPELAAIERDPGAAGASLVARAREASSLWGRTVRFARAGAIVAGTARTWAEDGGLEIVLPDGATTVVHAGDVAVTWDRAAGATP